MRKYFRFLVYLLVTASFSVANAGAYEDWWRAIKQDSPGPIVDLLKRGYDPNALDPNGLSGLYLALQEGSVKVAEVLIDFPKTNVEWRTKKDESPLMMASLKGHTALVSKLIARGADVNKPGWAPLHYAATTGQLQIMDLLLEHHAFIDAESPNKTTPLMMAAMYGTPQAVKLLLAAGADTNMRNELGMSAVDFAQRANRTESADLIAASIRSASPKGKW